jgi:hypothetical protein
MKTPYLVQRCEIRRPLVKGRISEALSLDYMGSAEFEFGAVPKSLRTLQAGVDRIKLTVDPRIKNGESSLRVLHMFTPQEFEQYFKYIEQMRANKLRLKESTRFEAGREPSKYSVCDVWWDIENDVFWSFDKIFMNRLPDCLVASWKYMDEQKAKS